nr:unnamed protein product [Digitaria exilis]
MGHMSAACAGEAPAADDVVCHGCFDGWLLYGPDDRDTYDRRHKCFLSNPLTGATVEMPLRFNDLANSSMLYVHKLISLCPPDVACAGYGGRRWYIDFVFHLGKIYAINTAYELFVHDVGDAEQAIKKVQGPKSTVAVEDQEEKFIRRYHYLVVP